MSKVRQNIEPAQAPAPLDAEPTGDLRPYVVFTRIKERGPHIYAGWLEAPDDEMAIVLAKEHYGRDQECVNIWAIRREHLTSSDGLYGSPLPPGERSGARADDGSTGAETPSPQPSSGGRGSYRVFTQKKAGDIFLEAGGVEAESPAAAIESAQRASRQAGTAHCVWIAPVDGILSTQPGELIWRTTDQTYRLARGYTKDVKEKWQRFRDEAALKEYEKEDLTDEF